MPGGRHDEGHPHGIWQDDKGKGKEGQGAKLKVVPRLDGTSVASRFEGEELRFIGQQHLRDMLDRPNETPRSFLDGTDTSGPVQMWIDVVGHTIPVLDAGSPSSKGRSAFFWAKDP